MKDVDVDADVAAEVVVDATVKTVLDAAVAMAVDADAVVQLPLQLIDQVLNLRVYQIEISYQSVILIVIFILTHPHFKTKIYENKFL